MRQRESAICLRTVDYSETSQVAHFLTRNAGTVRLLAKGTKRPKSKSGGAIDLLVEGELVFSAGSGEGLGTLIEFTETVSHAGLRRQAAPLNAALYMIELVGETIPPDDPHPAVFELLHKGLARLAQAGAPVQAVLAYFQWRLLRHVGLGFQADTCVSCGRDIKGQKDLYFTSPRGGLLCGGCERPDIEKYRVDAQTAGGLAALAAAEAGARAALGEQSARRVNALLAYHISYQFGKALKMARHAIGRA